MSDNSIKRSDAIEAIEGVDWYHQNKNKDMVSGANSSEHQAWYKADDIYKALEAVPSAEPIEWIPCSERLPEKYGEYLITTTYLDEPYVTTDEYFSYGWDDWGRDVVAWAERPKPWKGADDE